MTAKTPEQKAAAKAAKEAKKAEKAAGGAIAKAPKTVEKVLTQEDFDLDNTLAGQGYKIGDKVMVEDENVDAPDVVSGNKVAAPKKAADSVDIIKGNEYVRTYTREIHGDDFMDAAREYVEGHKGSAMADSDSITGVNVVYRAIDKKTKASYETSRPFTDKAEALRFRNEVNGVCTIA